MTTGTASRAPLRTLADVAALPPHTRPSGVQRAQILSLFVEAYTAGTSISELSALSGRSFGYVQRVMSDASTLGLVKLRGRGKAKQKQA